MTARREVLVGALRLALAAACAIALVFRFQWGLGWVEPSNYFAYLTIQSNMAFVLVTTVSGIVALRGRRTSARLDAVRAGVLTCTFTAGIVFAAILQQSLARGLPVYLPGSDVVLHFVLPLVALLDWAATPRTRPPARVMVFVLGYVATWGAITLVRGSITGWYPYYFLDPNQTNGPGELVLLSGIAVAVFVAVGMLVIFFPRRLPGWLRRRRAPDSGGPPPGDRRHPARITRGTAHRPQSRGAPGGRLLVAG
ncbi:putative Kef-type K+ transport protein [Leifsonia sp. AK011]|nr:putative Kef-type K+ transport protein [Leifsonia sp. AK011]